MNNSTVILNPTEVEYDTNVFFFVDFFSRLCFVLFKGNHLRSFRGKSLPTRNRFV